MLLLSGLYYLLTLRGYYLKALLSIYLNFIMKLSKYPLFDMKYPKYSTNESFLSMESKKFNMLSPFQDEKVSFSKKKRVWFPRLYSNITTSSPLLPYLATLYIKLDIRFFILVPLCSSNYKYMANSVCMLFYVKCCKIVKFKSNINKKNPITWKRITGDNKKIDSYQIIMRDNIKW